MLQQCNMDFKIANTMVNRKNNDCRRLTLYVFTRSVFWDPTKSDQKNRSCKRAFRYNCKSEHKRSIHCSYIRNVIRSVSHFYIVIWVFIPHVNRKHNINIFHSDLAILIQSEEGGLVPTRQSQLMEPIPQKHL